MLSAASAMDWTRRLFQSSMEQDGVVALFIYLFIAGVGIAGTVSVCPYVILLFRIHPFLLSIYRAHSKRPRQLIISRHSQKRCRRSQEAGPATCELSPLARTHREGRAGSAVAHTLLHCERSKR